MTPSTENLLSMLLGGTLNGFDDSAHQPMQQSQQQQYCQGQLPSGNGDYSSGLGNNNNNLTVGYHHQPIGARSDTPPSHSNTPQFDMTQTQLQQQTLPSLPTLPVQYLVPPQQRYQQYQQLQQQSNTNHYQSKSGLSVRL